MKLEVTVKLNAVVPEASLGQVTPEQLAALACTTVEGRLLERLKLMFVGWPTGVEITATVDGQAYPKP